MSSVFSLCRLIGHARQPVLIFKMKKLFLMAAALVALSGCTTIRNQPIDQKAQESIKGQSVAYSTRAAKPDFSAMTAGKAAFAMLGAIAMISEGNSIIASHNVPDPADEIASGLVQALQQSHGAVATPSIMVKGNAIDQLIASAGSAKYLVDVETVSWSFMYFPTDWTHYRVVYTAKARLIDTQTKAVVAEGGCNRVPDQSATSPTYDELLANGAKRLKAELSTAAQECLAKLKRETLKLS